MHVCVMYVLYFVKFFEKLILYVIVIPVVHVSILEFLNM